MIADLKLYPEYKDSGVEWLGQVPEQWDVRRLGHVGMIFKGSGGSKEDAVETGIPCVRYGDLYTTHKFFITHSRSEISPERTQAYTSLRYGDVLFAGSGETIDEIGKSAVNLLETSAVCGGDVIVLRPAERTQPRYMGYMLDSPAIVAQKSICGRGITVMHVYGNQIKNVRIPLPTIPEQAAIVRYLDYVDRRVRRLVRAKQKLIGMLEEQKQAIIHRAVTRGLNPDVPMKDSGVEWLGDVPEHWEVVRLRNVTKSVTSGSRGWSSYAADEGPLFIRVTNLNRMSLDMRFDDVVRLRLPETSEVVRTRVQAGDLLLSITAYIGSVAVVPEQFEEAYVSQHVARCALSNDAHNPRWLGYVLLSEVGQTHGKLSLYGGTKDGLSLDDVKNYPLLLPPRGEQDRLVAEIERAVRSIDTAVSRAKREIELLNEYRTRLIADVVTGKLDVRPACALHADREAAAKLPEEPEQMDEQEALADEEEADELDSFTEEMAA